MASEVTDGNDNFIDYFQKQDYTLMRFFRFVFFCVNQSTNIYLSFPFFRIFVCGERTSLGLVYVCYFARASYCNVL